MRIVVGENVQRRMDDGGESREESAIRRHPEGALSGGLRGPDHDGRLRPAARDSGRVRRTHRRRAADGDPILAFSLLEAAWILPHHLAHGGLSVRPSRRLARIRGAVQSGFDWTVETIYRPRARVGARQPAGDPGAGSLRALPRVRAHRGGFRAGRDGFAMDNNIAFVQVKLPAEATSDATRAVVASLNATVNEVREAIRVESGVDVERQRAVLVGQRIPIGVGESLADSPRRWARPSARSSGGSAPRKTVRESRRAPSRTASATGFERSRWTPGCP